jgi:hypothetical protein
MTRRKLLTAQKRVCRRFRAPFLEAPPTLKVGLARNVGKGVWPIHGLRHPPQGDTTGWYIWAGELAHTADFFEPVHVAHLPSIAPEVLPYLGLGPGWRFLIAPEQEDVWEDPSLLSV